jgi:uncharacterized protein YfaS (alpha-2-macroglobulin family)
MMPKMNLIVILTVLINITLPNLAFSQVDIPISNIRAELQDNVLRVEIPIRNQSHERLVDDFSVSLLDKDYTPTARVKKKIFLLNGEQTESLAVPVSAGLSDLKDVILRIDFQDQTWLRHFNEQKNTQELHVLGQREWIRGSQASMRVIVTKSTDAEPVVDANVSIVAESPDSERIELARTRTDNQGSASFQFIVPEDLSGTVTVNIAAESEAGQNQISTPVEVSTGSRILLITDKPVYQPKQLMHIRALAFHSATGKPLADQPATLEVYDGKGNKVFKKQATTSEFGIVSADFQLADEVNQGEYRIRALIDEDSSEKTVQVYEYVLPKFKVQVENHASYYAPGDTVKGYVEARYFFGRALDGAQVSVVANCFDVGFNKFATVEGKTNAEGRFEYEFEIPDRLVGQPSFDGNSIIQMDVRVTDTADHEEQKIHTFHVASDPLQIEFIPESGTLIPEVKNEIFVVASRPDGSVVSPELTVSTPDQEQRFTLECDENGLATMYLTPKKGQSEFELIVRAEMDGKKIDMKKPLTIDQGEEQILLRPDRGIYTVGDTMQIQVFSPASGKMPVFLDIMKNNQTVATHSLQVENGRAELNLPLDNTLAGTLTLNAYRIRRDSNMIRDTRQVVVLRSDDLNIEIVPNQEQYEPGAPASIRIAVTTPDGKPVQAALGMHIVDESVYSLSEKEPGLAKVFFAIERELLEPKYEIHGRNLNEIVLLPKRYSEDQTLSRALLAKVDRIMDYTVNINTNERNIEQARREMNTLSNQLWNLIQDETVERHSLEQLILNREQNPRNYTLFDPWETPYYIESSQNQATLISAGRDRSLDTDDDIVHHFSRFPEMLGGVRGRQLLRRFGAENENRVVDNQPVQNFRFNRALQEELQEDVPMIQMSEAMPAAPDAGGFGMTMEGFGRMGGNPEQLEKMQALSYIAPPGQAGENTAGEQLLMWSEGAVSDTDGDASAFFNGNQIYFEQESLQETNQEISAVDALPADLNAVSLGLPPFLTEETFSPSDSDIELFRLEDNQGPLAAGGQVNEEQLRQAIEQRLEDISLLSAQEVQKLRSALDVLDQRAETAEQKAVRVRRYFPETLYYTPELITDEKGEATVSLAMADSITTWRVSAMANSKAGAIGDTTSAMQVFKPFFADIDLPVALIQNDEVSIPVAVYNYLDQPQEVEIELEHAPWFTLLEGELKRTIQIAAQEVTSVTYRIKATELGDQNITVYAWSSQDSDAIGRSIAVRPNGEAQYSNHNGRLAGLVEERVALPEGRIEGADRLFVKIYPGVFSQVVEGLDAILQMPYGCFEQTSSTTYPNILALNYMKTSGNVTPAVEMKALEYINLGYQRLLTFEIDGGGFEVFGNPPATRVLSAYGLMEFNDMSDVYDVDPNVIERTKTWLLQQRNPDGSWNPDENYSHAEMWRSIQNNRVLVTAYIALALSGSNAGDQLQSSRDYLLRHADEAKDAYTLAILSNALLALAPEHQTTRDCIERLVNMAQVEDQHLYWTAEASMSFARGNHANVEVTAWAALALIEDGRFHSELGKVLNWLIEQKDPNGTWGTTHGTVLALKALLKSLDVRSEKTNATVTITVNGKEAETLQLTPENSDVFHQLDLTEHLQPETNTVRLNMDGNGQLLYQVVGKYFMPWDKVKTKVDSFDLKVDYDRTQLRRNDTVTCRISANNTSPMQLEMVMIDVGIPPGFRVEQTALEEYEKKGVIENYTIMSRQLLIYLKSMPAGQQLQLSIPMKATLPIVAKAPESTIYEYYNPENRETSTPQELEVK